MQHKRTSRIAGGGMGLLCPVTGAPLVSLFPSAMSATISYSATAVVGALTQAPSGTFYAGTAYAWALLPQEGPTWFTSTFSAAAAWSPGWWASGVQHWGQGPERQDGGTEITLVSEWCNPDFQSGGGLLSWEGVRRSMVYYGVGSSSPSNQSDATSVGIRLTATFDADGTWIKGLTLSEILWVVTGAVGTDGKNPERAYRELAAWSFTPERLTDTFTTVGRTAPTLDIFEFSGGDIVSIGTVTPTASVSITWGGT